MEQSQILALLTTFGVTTDDIKKLAALVDNIEKIQSINDKIDFIYDKLLTIESEIIK